MACNNKENLPSNVWPEVSIADEENRHELVISNLDKSRTALGIDPRLFNLKQLNFLSISNCGLEKLPEAVSNLSELTKLALQHNYLTTIPSTVGQLPRLKFLDVSFNNLLNLPDGLFNDLLCLETLMLDGNQLTRLPSLSGLKELHHLSVSNNKLETLPDDMDSCTKLLTIDASVNQLVYLPDLSWGQLLTLTTMNLCDNQLREISGQLADCRKLRQLMLERNPLKDNRLKKLAADPRPGPALMNYVAKLKKPSKVDKGLKSGGSENKPTSVDQLNNTMTKLEVSQSRTVEIVADFDRNAYCVQVLEPQSLRSGLRPRIYACSVSGVMFKDDTILKNFLRFQVKLHHDEGEERRAATLCTHDEAFISLPLTYSAIPVDLISIHALNMSKPKTARALLLQLQREAQGERKRRKLIQFPSLSRYLTLISPNLGPGLPAIPTVNLPPLPTVVDAAHTTLSVHPVTSCHQTRLSLTTSAILLEVTGTSEQVCKTILRLLISWLSHHASSVPTTSGETERDGHLLLRPLRIMNGSTGDYFGEYPTTTDIASPDFILPV